MAWESSTRRSDLPGDWNARRRKVLARDGYVCVALLVYGDRCEERATDVDHIAGRTNHDLENLQALCIWHHKQKTGREAAAARKGITMKRAPEPHPGYGG